MTSKNHLAPPDAATTPAPMRRPLPGTLPGAATYAVLATLMIPFFAVLHLVAVIQSRDDWDDRVRRHAIPNRDEAATP